MSSVHWPLSRPYRHPGLAVTSGRTLWWGRQTYLMGIINASPDSFSGDAIDRDPAEGQRRASALAAAGADIIDIGGESTRPGSDPVDPAEQIRRVVPVIAAVRGVCDIAISIDTSSGVVADAALEAGATMVNDVNGLRSGSDLVDCLVERGVPVVLMHNQRGRRHVDVIDDICEGFDESLETCRSAGIDLDRVILDPGFGFGWSVEQNLEMLRRLPELWRYELPLMVGTSRKSTIGTLLDHGVDQRRFGTAATVSQAVCAGIDVVRVHDVAEMRDVVRTTDAIVR